MSWKLFFWCGLASLALAIAGYRWLSYIDHSTLRYIDKITGVKLPADVAIISEFDNGETIIGGKYRLKPRDINSFLADHPFHQIDKRLPRFSQYNIFDNENRIPLADSTSLTYFTGCKPGNSWLFTLNKTTGELWIEVKYPDMSGDSPACP